MIAFHRNAHHLAASCFAAACLVAAIWSMPAAAGANEEVARAAYEEALALVAKAERAASPEARWALYESAHSNLQQIKQVFPKSRLSRSLRDRDSVEGSRYAALARALVLTAKGVCETDFTAVCVLRLAFTMGQVSGALKESDFVQKLSQAQAAAGDLERALVSARMVLQVDLGEAAAPVMAALVGAGKVGRAIDEAGRYLRRRDRDRAFLAIVRALADAGDVATGRSVAALISGAGGDGDAGGGAGDRALALAALAASRALNDRAKERTALFAASVDLAATLGEATARASILFRIARLQLGTVGADAARPTIARALAAARSIADRFERSHVLDLALRNYSTVENISRHAALVDALRASVARLDDTYQPVIFVIDAAEAKFKVGDQQGARALLQGARETAHGMESAVDRIYALGRILSLAARMGDAKAALEDWQAIARDHWHARFIAQALAKGGDIEGLRNLIAALANKNDRDYLVNAYVVPALAEAARLEEARIFARRFEDPVFASVAWTAIVKGEAVAGNYEAALAAAANLRHTDDRTDALGEIAMEYLKQGRISEAHGVLRMAFRGIFGPTGDLSGEPTPDPVEVDEFDFWAARALKEIGERLVESEATTR